MKASIRVEIDAQVPPGMTERQFADHLAYAARQAVESPWVNVEHAAAVVRRPRP